MAADRSLRVLTSRRTWLIPVALIIALATILPAVYLSATASPGEHVSALPVAVVIEPQTVDAEPSFAQNVAEAVTDAAGQAVALTPMNSDELARAMADDRVAGAVVIPPDFDAGIGNLAGPQPGAAPVVTIRTNAGDGGLSHGLVVGHLLPVLDAVGDRLGEQLVSAAPAGAPAASIALLAQPFDVEAEAYESLPEGSGLGTSAFYYALILVLIAFIGGSLVGPIVDGALGFSPSEVGPLVARRPAVAASRRRTFVAKASILAGAAPFAALALQLIAAAIGVTASDPLALWLFSTAVVAAIGTSVLAVFSALGAGFGSLVNTLFFVALAMVSSGGIVPLEATPPFFRWVATFAPFRHVVDGVRSLFYFDGSTAAGLGSAWIAVAIGAAVGVGVGLLVTTLYDRVPRFARI